MIALHTWRVLKLSDKALFAWIGHWSILQ